MQDAGFELPRTLHYAKFVNKGKKKKFIADSLPCVFMAPGTEVRERDKETPLAKDHFPFWKGGVANLTDEKRTHREDTPSQERVTLPYGV
jgi:hypothetical protein